MFDNAFWKEQKEFYDSEEWSQLREACLIRDGHRCTYVKGGIRCTETTGLQVHHLIPRSKRGPDKLYNLRTRCTHHHEMEHEHLQRRAKNATSGKKATYYMPGASKKKIDLETQRNVVFKYKPTLGSKSRRWR